MTNSDPGIITGTYAIHTRDMVPRADDAQAASEPPVAPAKPDPAPSPVILREGCIGDRQFVIETWLRHYRRRSEVARMVPEHTYCVEQRALIDALLTRSAVICAVDREDTSLVLGYIVCGARSVHWMHVKSTVRGRGLGHTLAHSIPGLLYWTHATDDAEALWRAMDLHLTYNPYRAWL